MNKSQELEEMRRAINEYLAGLQAAENLQIVDYDYRVNDDGTVDAWIKLNPTIKSISLCDPSYREAVKRALLQASSGAGE